MLKNFTPRHYYTHREYRLEWTDEDGNGFSFPCDANGNVNISDMAPEGYANLRYCMANPEGFEVAGELKVHEWRCHDDAHGTCSCGREVYLWDQYYGACECECGKWYNLFGQEILPPEHWESDPSEEEPW